MKRAFKWDSITKKSVVLFLVTGLNDTENIWHNYFSHILLCQIFHPLHLYDIICGIYSWPNFTKLSMSHQVLSGKTFPLTGPFLIDLTQVKVTMSHQCYKLSMSQHVLPGKPFLNSFKRSYSKSLLIIINLLHHICYFLVI